MTDRVTFCPPARFLPLSFYGCFLGPKQRFSAICVHLPDEVYFCTPLESISGESALLSKIQHLKERLGEFEQSIKKNGAAVLSSGCQPIDEMLPQSGFSTGSLVEWLESGPGCSAAGLSLLTANQACRGGKYLVVVDRNRVFYPPAAAAWQVDLSRTIVVRPADAKDEQWALDQALRSPQVAAVVAWPEQLHNRTFRRLQLAVESGGGLGLLIRPAKRRAEPSWASVRLLISPQTPTKMTSTKTSTKVSSRKGFLTPFSVAFSVELLRCRGEFVQRRIEVEMDERGTFRKLLKKRSLEARTPTLAQDLSGPIQIHEMHPSYLASQLASSKTTALKARA